MSEVALAEVQAAILAGHFAPGEPLLLEPLAASLDMSVSPVREALRRLEQLGFVEHTPRRGSRVSRLSAGELADVFEVRLALETIAVRRAATWFDSDDEARAAAALKRLADAYDSEELLAVLGANKSFHLGLYQAGRSEYLLRQIGLTWDQCDRYRAWIFRDDGMASVRELERDGHEQILAACLAHDPDRAELALKAHLAVFARLVTDRLPTVEVSHDGEPVHPRVSA